MRLFFYPSTLATVCFSSSYSLSSTTSNVHLFFSTLILAMVYALPLLFCSLTLTISNALPPLFPHTSCRLHTLFFSPQIPATILLQTIAICASPPAFAAVYF